jgi:hypothetical protein
MQMADGAARVFAVPPQIGLAMSEAGGCCCWAHSEGTGGGGTVKDKLGVEGIGEIKGDKPWR